MPFYGAQGIVDAYQAMPVNRIHQLQGDQLRLALDAERRRQAAEPMLGQTWYELANQYPPQPMPLPQPPMPGTQSMPMRPPGPAGLYPPPQASMLPRPSPLMAGVPPGVPLPNPPQMQGMPLPGPAGPQQSPLSMYRPLRPGVIGEGEASRLPPLMSTRPTTYDTGETQVREKPASELPIDRDAQGNITGVRSVGEPGVQVTLDMNDPAASRGTPYPAASVVPPPVGTGGGLPMPPSEDGMAGGMSREPAQRPSVGALVGAAVASGSVPPPSYMQSPDMMAFIRAAQKVGVNPRDLPEMVKSASPVMAKEMLAAQAAERAWTQTYIAHLTAQQREMDRQARIDKSEGELGYKYDALAARIEHWQAMDAAANRRIDAIKEKAEKFNLMNHAQYRTALKYYDQEAQNWRATNNLLNNPNLYGKDRKAVEEQARDQLAKMEQREQELRDITERLSGVSVGKEGKEVDQPARGETVLPEPPVGTIRKGYRYKGNGAGNPNNWEKVE